MKKQLFLFGAALVATVTLASCGEVAHEHTYVEHKEVASTYYKPGTAGYYTCEDCNLIFDANKNVVASLEDLKLPLKGYDTSVKSIEDGQLVLDVTPTELKEIYDGRVTLTVNINGKSYEAPIIKLVEEVNADQAYIIARKQVVVGLKDKDLAAETSAKVGDAVAITFKKSGYESLIPFFNIESGSDVTLYGKEIEVTFTEAKKTEFEELVELIKADIAEATATTEHPDTSNAKPFADVDAEYEQFIDGYYYVIDEYRYASIIADTTTAQADLDKESEIFAFAQNFEVWDQEIDIAMSKSIYRNDFFENMTDAEIDAYIAGLDPETTAQANAYQEEMDKAVKAFESKKSTAFEALTTYVTNATEYAKLNGYNDYINYAYKNVYDREYLPSDTNSLEGYIKDYIVPIYKSAYNSFVRFQNNTTSEYWSEFVDLYYGFFGLYFDQLYDYSEIIGGEYQTNFKQYFLDGDYFYSAKKNDNVTGYVSSFADGHPYMFLGPDYQGVKTFIHEFGHYNANATEGDTGSYDLAETQSQGNEMLFYTYFATTGAVTEEVVNQFANFMVYAMSSAILEGYLYNEVEKMVYTCDLTTLTEQALTAEWNNTCEAIGLEDYKDSFRIEILLNYRCYYISYAASAIAALEIYSLGLTDWDAAVASYTKIYEKHDENATFTSVLEDAGLYSVFTEDAYKLIGKAFPRLFKNA